MDEDSLYIGQFLEGDEKGFEMLVRKYQDRLLNIVYSLVGRDRESEDIVQEAFLKAYHSLKNFRKESQFSTWLYRIVVNTAYDFLRRRRRFVRDEALLEASPTALESPREALLSREKEALVQEALEDVPLKFRAALVLKEIEGLSYMEISRVLGCSIGTVESKIYRARQLLKDGLLGAGGKLI